MLSLLQEFPGLILSVLVISPFVLYGVVRIVSSAWYRSKFDHVRRWTNDDTDQGSKK